MSESLNNKIFNATKWSAVTEVLAKLVSPISTMVLARLLTPEAFGVVATLNIVIAFAEIFTDAGFQRYLIQHEFENDEIKEESINVAFWSNLILSFSLWGVVCLFSEQLASFVGCPGLGKVLIVACSSIPIIASSSIQMAIFRRSLDFKTLFWRRLATVIVPIFVTIPLAIWLKSYWALVIGTIVTNLVNVILLTIKSSWTPRFYFSISRFKEMLSFSSWSIIDSILIWATGYIDIFFISRALDSYYLGIYRTSITTVGHFTTLITASVLPVVMPAISRLQDNIPEMQDTLLKFQKYTSIFLLPLGAGIFIFSDLITKILLGNQWDEASSFIGLWALMEVLTVIFARFCSNVYPAIGKPRLSVLVQMLHLVVLVPAVIISGAYGFTPLYVTRSLIRIELILVNFAMVYYTIKLNPLDMIKNVFPELSASVIMILIGYFLLSFNDSIWASILWIFACATSYFIVLWLMPRERFLLYEVKSILLAKLRTK